MEEDRENSRGEVGKLGRGKQEKNEKEMRCSGRMQRTDVKRNCPQTFFKNAEAHRGRATLEIILQNTLENDANVAIPFYENNCDII